MSQDIKRGTFFCLFYWFFPADDSHLHLVLLMHNGTVNLARSKNIATILLQ